MGRETAIKNILETGKSEHGQKRNGSKRKKEKGKGEIKAGEGTNAISSGKRALK